ncbi:MAG: type II secretion system F family protein [Candidatus Saccharibacteria bacterium]|nr:type II secretion system F family protein [Candidatus Saccharibacteria bacterium]
MASFEYVAIDKTGKRAAGIIEAQDNEQATLQLQQRGLRPVKVAASKTSPDILAKLGIGAGNKKIKLKDMVIFTRQLATMINAGVPLVRSLATLQTQTENPNFKRTVSDVTKDVEGGMTFADALEKHPHVFSPVYINMVRAGEAGGILDAILKKLATQQEKDAEIRGKFKSALTYPTILLTITFSVFMILMIFVMPGIGEIILDLGGENAELPPLTEVMLGISDFMVNQWYVVLGVIFGGGFILRKYTKTPAGRMKKDKFLLRTPILKTIVRKVAIARFARIFASLMSAGVTVIESINITAKAIGNAVIEEELTDAAKEVANGKQLSTSLSESSVFPPIVSQMLAIGEETGQTDEILVKVADFYEAEVDATVDALSSILEPIMIVILGTMVGLIAISVIGPISDLSSQI